MSGSGWVYLLFTAGLVAVFAGIVVHYYRRSRRERVEAPKYRMLEDDGEPRRTRGPQSGTEAPDPEATAMEDAFRDMERHNRIPRGFLLLFFGLIAWGVCYIAAYTPAFSGWSQYETLRREIETGRKPATAASALAENPYKRDAKSIAEGKAIYRGRCAECHGEALTGDVGPGLTGALKHGETDGAKYASIAKGRPDGMPGFEAQLGPERIWKVVAYIDSVRESGKKP